MSQPSAPVSTVLAAGLARREAAEASEGYRSRPNERESPERNHIHVKCPAFRGDVARRP